MQLKEKYTFNPATDLIGKGGFGRVYKAWDKEIEEFVALKRTDDEPEKVGYDLITEVKKARGLIHPNLCRYFDVFRHQTIDSDREVHLYQFAVMEYINGGQIDQIDFASLPDAAKRELLSQILEGLDYLHSKNVIHRDIKPSNILIQKEDDRLIIKITDFGISKTIVKDNALVSNAIGSLEYMAPEQFRTGNEIGVNADLWAFGVLLYELMTGELPFGSRKNGSTEAEIINNIQQGVIPHKVKNIIEPYRSIILKCLVIDSKQRCIGAKELINQLDDTIIPTKPIEDESGDLPKKTSLVFLTVLLAIVGILLYIYLADNDKPDMQNRNGAQNPEAVQTVPQDTRMQQEVPDSRQAVAGKDEPSQPVSYKIIEDSENVSSNRRTVTEGNNTNENQRQKPIDKDPGYAWEESDNQGTFTDLRDGKSYRWVEIGSQIWMAENLSYVPDNGTYWDYADFYGDTEKYGILYDWTTAMRACPPGWKLPLDGEWTQLIEFASGYEVAGINLKAETGWRYKGNGNNYFGFSALPGGYYHSLEGYKYVSWGAYWWTSTDEQNMQAWIRDTGTDVDVIRRYQYDKNTGFSVRCIKE